MGTAAWQFVRDRWNPREVSRNFLRVLSDDMPSEWFFDPNQILYLHGWGLHEDAVREQVRAVFDVGVNTCSNATLHPYSN